MDVFGCKTGSVHSLHILFIIQIQCFYSSFPRRVPFFKVLRIIAFQMEVVRSDTFWTTLRKFFFHRLMSLTFACMHDSVFYGNWLVLTFKQQIVHHLIMTKSNFTNKTKKLRFDTIKHFKRNWLNFEWCSEVQWHSMGFISIITILNLQTTSYINDFFSHTCSSLISRFNALQWYLLHFHTDAALQYLLATEQKNSVSGSDIWLTRFFWCNFKLFFFGSFNKPISNGFSPKLTSRLDSFWNSMLILKPES